VSATRGKGRITCPGDECPRWAQAPHDTGENYIDRNVQRSSIGRPAGAIEFAHRLLQAGVGSAERALVWSSMRFLPAAHYLDLYVSLLINLNGRIKAGDSAAGIRFNMAGRRFQHSLPIDQLEQTSRKGSIPGSL
jgi:hypothetical protein